MLGRTDMFLLSSRLRKHLVLALLAGLALRLFFVQYFPTISGDTPIYEDLARNWLDHHVFGITVDGRIVPADLRTPGYPGFLAVIYTLFGRSRTPIMLAQVVLDLGTCVLTALLAAILVPESWRRRTAIAALWLCATCPFLANYCGVPLTEVLTTFLMTAALLVLLRAVRASTESRPATWQWLFAGMLAGLGTLVRPETPLLLIAAGLALLFFWRRRADLPKLLRAAVLMAVGLVLPLLPWAVRNWVTFHKVQFLSSRYAQMPGEFVPLGFFDWTRTWLWRYGDVYTILWKYDAEPISMDDFPSYAFDSPEERARVAQLLDAYNDITSATPEFDAVFAQLAAERTRRHPLRTYLTVPLRRVFGIWFTPRVEYLPLSGHLTPIYKEWDEDRPDFLISLSLACLNVIYLALAVLGTVWFVRRRSMLERPAVIGVSILLACIVVRTVFLTHLEAPEPRYVIECFPMLFVLASLAFMRKADLR
jgi:4-amino-4-deoxy-L-arabinose transferase-like glycosyltransferase